ncbi:MAG: hypothetical protein QOJ81_1659 [Chloroflexota bacterium]|jgi:Tol biopolymer transport system component|nr:hypothetical protein [Chloroflexota bacterium]
MNELSHDLIDPIETRLARLVRAYTDGSDLPIDAGAVGRSAMRVRPPASVPLRWAVLVGLLALTLALAIALGLGARRSNARILVTAGGQIVSIDPDAGTQALLGAGLYPVWSPDRTRIAFEHEGATWVMSADGSGRNRLRQDLARGSFTGPSVWSSDGTQLMIAGANGLALVEVDGGSERNLGMTTYKDFGTGALAPDGAHLAIVLGPGVLYVMDISSDGVEPSVTEKGSLPWLPRWSPDGKLLAWADATGVHTTAVDGTQRRDYHVYVFGELIDSLAWSPDGTRLAYTDRSRAAIVVDAASGEDREILTPPEGAGATSVAWSRDGSRLVVAFESRSNDLTDDAAVWVVNADGSGARLLAEGIDETFDRGPNWW